MCFAAVLLILGRHELRAVIGELLQVPREANSGGSGGFGELGLERHSHLKTSKIPVETHYPNWLEKALFHLKPHKFP